MVHRLLAAIVVTQIGFTSSGYAQPPGRTPARRSSREPPPLGHPGFVLGIGVTMGLMLHGAGGGALGFESFLGWSLGRIAYCGWGKVAVGGDGHLDVGGAVRLWPWPRFGRVYTEGRLAYEQLSPHLYDGNPCGDDVPYEQCELAFDRHGAVVGATLGIELFTSDLLTVDLRPSLSFGLIVDYQPYVLADLGLAMQLY